MFENLTINFNAVCNSCAEIACCSSELTFMYLYAHSSMQKVRQQRISCIHLYFVNLTSFNPTNKQLMELGLQFQTALLGPLLFLLYINDLPQITHENSKVILYADDTSIIITSPNPSNYENIVNKIFENINRWFNSNLLSLNLEKKHTIYSSGIKIAFQLI